MKYENYYYLDANIKVEGNIRESCIPKPYRTLPYVTKRSLWLDYREDDGLLDEASAIFDIYYSLEILEKYMNQPKNGKVFIKQKGKCVGSFQECGGYAAANADPRHRNITEYTMRLKRHQKNRETWFFIDGETDFLHSKREINHWVELTEEQIEKN